MTLHPLVFSALIVFASASDWELSFPSGEIDCVNPPPRRLMSVEEACHQAQQAARYGWLPGVPRGTETMCKPHPQCITPREGCIIGYRGPRAEGYCR